MATYSFGEDSPMKFDISDKLARLYNEAMAEFLKAQRRFTQKVGRPWNPDLDPIRPNWSAKHRKAWRDFAKIYHKVYELEGPFHVNEIAEDFLVKNATQIASKATKTTGRVIVLAAVGGAVYELLRGL